jgi:exodeoxyribonuclease VII large subunit
MPKKIQQASLELSSQQPVFSVSAFLDYVNEVLNLENISVKGEISGWKIHPTGIYFSLKDKEDGSVLDCYMSPYVYRGLGLNVEDGMEVKVGGIPSIYKPKGRFSFRLEMMELVGEGSLKKAYELLKRKLQEEGLYDRKRPLPEFIRKIGIITSRSGAVIDDFRKNIDKLGHDMYLYDVRVEGARAVNLITNAVKWFNKNKPDLDVLVIMRGGGSLEDLQAFNHELVCREVFASKIPTICAIGHDRDVPIMCLVGDAATSTPTAAAMLINKTWDRLRESLLQYERELFHGIEGLVQDVRSRADMTNILHILERALGSVVERMQGYGTYLESANPERNLQLGYSLIRDNTGKVVTKAARLKKGDQITAQLAEGLVAAEVQ